MELKINEKYYDLIKHGIKIYEMRLIDEKMKEHYFKTGEEYLIFACGDKKIKCNVEIHKEFKLEDFITEKISFSKLVNKIFFNAPYETYYLDENIPTEMAYKELKSFYPEMKLSDKFVVFELKSVQEMESEK